jgi:AcrR family transcriptional regulator
MNELVQEYRRPHPPRWRDAHRAGHQRRRRALAVQPPTGPLDSTPGARFRRPFHNAAVEACARSKPLGMLDDVSGTRTATARPADRGGRGARERILTAATTLFHREGIHATGVERLTEHAHVSKRTFYQHFSSKDELVEQYLRRIHHAGGMPSEQAIDTADASPRGRLLAIFDGAPGSRFRGCPFHNAAVEAADAMPGVEDIVHEHKVDFTTRLIHTATEAGARDPYRLGNQLAVLFEGAKALATSLNDTSPLLHARSAAETLIDAATINSGR